MKAALASFLSGLITMGFVIAALFFFRFWKRTHDALFLAFGLAFLLLALNQALIGLSDVTGEERSFLYIPRLAAFALLIAAIVGKNIGGSQKS
jgi:uncharacterized membrane protein YqgA involved in biofilm formation